MPGFIMFDLGRCRRTWADDTHLAAQHIDQLGYFVQAGTAQPLADASNTRIVLPLWPFGIGSGLADQLVAHLVGSIAHRAEFEHAEATPIFADTLMPKQYRAGRIELDRQRNNQSQWYKEGGADRNQGDVNDALD